MQYKYTDGNRIVEAYMISEAVDKLFETIYYKNPNGRGSLSTVYTYRHKDYTDVEVYQIGDKQGKEWGENAAEPARYRVRKCD